MLTPESAMEGIGSPAKVVSVTKVANPFIAVGTSLKSTGAATPPKLTGAK